MTGKLIWFSTFVAWTANAQIIGNLFNTGGNLGITTCNSRTSYPSVGTIPTSFDAREAWPLCIGAVGNQGACGSCWAYAAAQTFSDRLCVASNASVSRCVSAQDFVDCDTGCKGGPLTPSCQNGCNGGYLDLAWDYLKDTGTVGATCVPYEAAEASCSTSCVTSESFTRAYRVSSCFQITGATAAETVSNLQKVIMTEGTVEAGFMVYEDFYDYTSGVYIYDGSSAQSGGHAIRIIGWGEEGGVAYWLCLNQWGTAWGMNGAFKIRRGTDEVQIESNLLAGYPVTSGLSSQEYCAPPSSSSASTSSSPGNSANLRRLFF